MHVTHDGFLDEPLEKVWKRIADPSALRDHPLVRGEKVLDQKGDTIVLESVTVTHNGKRKDLATLKITINEPKGYDVEYLSGPLAGSKFTRVFTAKGEGTRVEVSGDFKMRGADDATTKKEVLALLDEEPAAHSRT